MDDVLQLVDLVNVRLIDYYAALEGASPTALFRLPHVDISNDAWRHAIAKYEPAEE